MVGIIKTFGNFAEIRRPEQALKLFIRFAIAKGIITYGMELMVAIFNIVQGITSKIIETTGIGNNTQMTLPQEIIDAINKVGFFDSIPLRCSNFNRKSVHNSFIIYYDFDCIWQIF